jgi:hypothetical protein
MTQTAGGGAECRVEKALEPFADDPSSHRQAPANLRESQPLGPQQHDTRALRQAGLNSRGPLPMLKLSLFSRRKENREG